MSNADLLKRQKQFCALTTLGSFWWFTNTLLTYFNFCMYHKMLINLHFTIQIIYKKSHNQLLLFSTFSKTFPPMIAINLTCTADINLRPASQWRNNTNKDWNTMQYSVDLGNRPPVSRVYIDWKLQSNIYLYVLRKIDCISVSRCARSCAVVL